MYYYFKQNALEYEEIKKLLSVKSKIEYVKCVITKGIIEQEYAIDYVVNCFRENYRRCERVQEIDYIKFKTFLVKESSDYTIDYESINCFKLVNNKKAEFCKITEDQKVEFCELIEDQKVDIIESCELIEDQKVKLIESKCQKVDKVIENPTAEDINMVKPSKNESNKIKDLELTIDKLKEIARLRGSKNYENLSRIELVKEIDKLEPTKELEKKKITSSFLLKGKKSIGFKPKKKANKKEVLKLSLKKK